jgi:hypothetical protein
MISDHQARLFWEWFGQVLQTIRFKRHIHNMWQSGYVNILSFSFSFKLNLKTLITIC